MKTNKILSHEIGSIVEIQQDVDVITFFHKLVKTCPNILWLCTHRQKGRQSTLKIIFKF